MSDVRDPETDQNEPVASDLPYVQDLLLADIEERKQHGIRKYGVALQAGNGRSMLKDAYDEVLDLAVYVRGLLYERDESLDFSWDQLDKRPSESAECLRRSAPDTYVAVRKIVLREFIRAVSTDMRAVGEGDPQLTYVAEGIADKFEAIAAQLD